jgi:hypothetical protein
MGLGRELFGILSETEKEEEENEAELLYLEDIISADPDGSLKRLEKEFGHLEKGSRLSPLYHFLVGRCYFGKKAQFHRRIINRIYPNICVFYYKIFKKR